MTKNKKSVTSPDVPNARVSFRYNIFALISGPLTIGEKMVWPDQTTSQKYCVDLNIRKRLQKEQRQIDRVPSFS